jgi:EmrB/QacA subfamily drug resistance transporter
MTNDIHRSDTITTPEPPTRKPILATIIVAVAFFMEMLDATIIVTALPMMAESFGTSPVELSLGLTSYMLAIAIFIPASGWAADRFGARAVFCTAIAVFTLASLLCGATSSLWQFVLLRFVQGMGGAMMSPVGRLVVLESAEKKDLARVLNLLVVPGLIGPVLGPPLGGFIVTYTSWRWIFFINVPIGIIGMVLVYLFVRERRVRASRPFDIAGFGLNGASLALLLYGLDSIGGHGPGWQVGAALMLAGLVLGWLAIRRALRHEHPLVDLSAMRVRTFVVPTIGGSLIRLAIAAPTFLVPLLLQVGLGMSAFVAGLYMLTHTAGDLAIKAVTTQTLRRIGFRSMLLWSGAGFALLIAACALFTASTPAWLMAVVLIVGGVARSLQMTAQTALQFADLPREEITAASTLSSVIQQVTRSFGVAFAAILLNLSVAIGGRDAAGLADFRTALVIIAAIGLGSLLWYWPLARDTGAAVSGHKLP